MMTSSDNTAAQQTIDQTPLTAKIFLSYGFTFYQSSYNKANSGWKYRDKDGGELVLVPKESRLQHYDRRYECEIYFPQYTDTPQLLIPDPHERTVKATVYNEGQLRLFVEFVERAAELRMDIKRRSDELKKNIQENLWKG